MTGRLDLRRATMIHEHATPLAEDHYDMAIRAGASPEVAEKAAARIAGDLERHVLKWAPRQAPKELGRCLRKTVIRLDPDYAERHRKDAVDGRYVSHRANTDGTGNLYAKLGAAEVSSAGFDRGSDYTVSGSLSRVVLW
jgi:hypothetical protein